MERRSEDINPSQFNQEITPALKLPLAPIVSTPSDIRRANPTVAARRGSSIFSPSQTLDHHPPRQQERDDDPIPDPDPAPTSAGAASNSKTPPPPPQATTAASSAATSPVIRYRECLKNHAASMGGHVVDGCGEFMPGGEEGTAEALRCAACDCHRNFHRKEAEGGGEPPPQQSHYYSYTSNYTGNNTNTHRRNPFFQTPAGPTPPTMVNFGSSSGAAGESSSEDLNMFQSSGGGHAVNRPSFSRSSKKRFRTKFSQEQKNRMQELAEKLGWRIQKQDEQEVEKFSNETGIKRQVFKVWMHNNKQAMKKRQS